MRPTVLRPTGTTAIRRTRSAPMDSASPGLFLKADGSDRKVFETTNNSKQKEQGETDMVYPRITKSQVGVPAGTPDRTLFVCVTDSYEEELKGNPFKHADLEDCARGYWRVGDIRSSHAKNCDWLFAHKHGRIVGVFRIDRPKGWVDWRLSPKKTWPTDSCSDKREACEVIPDAAMSKKFDGQIVHLGRCPNPLRGYFK